MQTALTGSGEVSTLEIVKVEVVGAPPEVTFEALLEELGPANEVGPGMAMPMKLEAWPGGRWYRDLGGNTGHLWGHVQVIKPPTLLEICGPLFMSYPAVSHVQYRLKAEGGGTRLQVVHKAIGLITAEHREGVQEGWAYGLKKVREMAEKREGR